MSSKSSKNNGSCLGYFVILGILYYIYDKYKDTIWGVLKIIAALFLIIILYKLIKIFHNFRTKPSRNNSEIKENTAIATDFSISEVPLNASGSAEYSYSSTSECFQEQKKDNSSCFDHSIDYSELLSDDLDIYFRDAAYFVLEKGIASIGMLQRLFKISFSRAAKIMEQLEAAGIVSVPIGTEPRKILMTSSQFQEALENGTFSSLHVPDTSSSVQAITPLSINRFEYYNGKFDYMTGRDFEEYCAHLLYDVGFSDITTTPITNDYGVDILAKYNESLFAIQCKCYSSNIGVDAVQEVFSGLQYYHANIGIVLTNQYFTSQAKELASVTGVHLWDRDSLYELIDASINGTDFLSLMLNLK
nr:restriction endonuclease [uncultured Blautia sp.]